MDNKTDNIIAGNQDAEIHKPDEFINADELYAGSDGHSSLTDPNISLGFADLGQFVPKRLMKNQGFKVVSRESVMGDGKKIYNKNYWLNKRCDTLVGVVKLPGIGLQIDCIQKGEKDEWSREKRH